MDERRPELRLASHISGTELLYTIDVTSSGLEIGRHVIKSESDFREDYLLALPNYSQRKITARKVPSEINGEQNPALVKLESKLASLADRGLLASTHFILGVKNDPFHPFKDRFDLSMRILKIFRRYRPRSLTIQTRSQIVVIALEVLKSLGESVTINFGIETNLDQVSSLLTPELPLPSERLRAMLALQRFGIKVTAQVAPVLPYGNWQTDAPKFAEILVKHSHRIFIESFVAEEHRKGTTNLLSRSLLSHYGKVWATNSSAEPLIIEVNKLSPTHLSSPPTRLASSKQLGMFVA